MFGGPNGSGGGSATAEIGDFLGRSPLWRAVGSLNCGRVWANSVLFDGKVLAVGGGTGGTYTNPVKQAEHVRSEKARPGRTWPPSRPRVSTTRPQSCCRTTRAVGRPRQRHVQTTAEIYSPPYLFKGSRPTISAAPATATYGSYFNVSTPQAARSRGSS